MGMELFTKLYFIILLTYPGFFLMSIQNDYFFFTYSYFVILIFK